MPPLSSPAAPSAQALRVIRPGRVPYAEAWEMQRAAADTLRSGEGPETLFLLEHPPVVTLGRRARTDGNLRIPREELVARGIEVVDTDRGGDVTYHGPGQLVGYPVLDLRRRRSGPRRHLWQMEEVLIGVLADFGVAARREAPHTGVWTDHGKIAAMGIRVSAGVSLHGFALNVNADLGPFGLIVPCGITGRPVACMRGILGRETPMGEVMDRVETRFLAPLPEPPEETA